MRLLDPTFLTVCAIALGAWLLIALGHALAFGLKAWIAGLVAERYLSRNRQQPPQP